jgi:PAS domain S-box-containing protein
MNKTTIVSTSSNIALKLKVLAKEKEDVRRRLAVTAKNLKKSRETLEKKVLERTKDLERVRARNEAMLASIGDGLVVVDKEGKITYINKSFEEMLGLKVQEVIGRSMVEVVPREDQNGTAVQFKKRILTQVLLGKKFVADLTNPFYYIRKDKSRFPVSSIITPVVLDGKIIGAVETFRDITKEKDIDKAKSEFVSLASHQLRTPLSTINWYTEMLLAEDVGKIMPEQKKYLDEVYRGTQRMIELVNALLNISRIELGTFVVDPEPTDIIKLAQGEIEEQKLQIDTKHLKFSSSFKKDIPVILADPKLLHMVMQNLLTNAVKYTPEGGKVTLEIILSDAQGRTTLPSKIKRSHVLIKVSDTGYGIPKNQQDKIFTKLFRADNVRDKDTEGTGLGLYIVKSIIEHSGGKIWFESPGAASVGGKDLALEEYPGTTFYATLPLNSVKKSH